LDLRFIEIPSFTRETWVIVDAHFAWEAVLMRFAIRWILIRIDKDLLRAIEREWC
tara:strand:+ start:88 stop:252 length:165 start_codon:yes stop_codon:yes gene_type:complete